MWCYGVLEQLYCGGALAQMWLCGGGMLVQRRSFGVVQQLWCGEQEQVHKYCCCNVDWGLSVCKQGWLMSGQKVSESSCVGLVCNAAEWERGRGNAPLG